MPIDQPPGAAWLSRYWEELRSYNFQWVAATGEELIAAHSELDIVINEVIERELANQVVYALVDFDEEYE
jgi:hypothetical protein